VGRGRVGARVGGGFVIVVGTVTMVGGTGRAFARDRGKPLLAFFNNALEHKSVRRTDPDPLSARQRSSSGTFQR
jgi:hypothetical protein